MNAPSAQHFACWLEDFRTALNALCLLDEEASELPREHEKRQFYYYLSAAAVAYGRPFSDAREQPFRFSHVGVRPSGAQLEVHRWFIAYRDTVTGAGGPDLLGVVLERRRRGTTGVMTVDVWTRRDLPPARDRQRLIDWLVVLMRATDDMTHHLAERDAREREPA